MKVNLTQPEKCQLEKCGVCNATPVVPGSTYTRPGRVLTDEELLILPRDVASFGPSVQHINDLLATIAELKDQPTQ